MLRQLEPEAHMEAIAIKPDLEYAKKKYEAIMELVNGGKLQPKYPNSVHGHLIGRMGEEAVLEWAKRKGLRPFPNYQVTDSGCDIFLQSNRKRLEVKAWKAEQYEWGGRAISEKQLWLIRKKADCIIWCSVELATNEVKIMGWSEVGDFDNAPLVEKNHLKSYQLETVRGIETFHDVVTPGLTKNSLAL